MNGPALNGGVCARDTFASGVAQHGALTQHFTAAQRSARSLLVRRLERLAWGRIELHDALGTCLFGGADGATAHVRIEVRDPRLYVDVALRGSVGAGEAFVAGRWNCDDLPLLARIFARNRDALNGLESGVARLGATVLGWWHARRDNTRTGSRANIAAHYDLGNDFYALFLDPTRMYSCAWFARPEMTLEEAQLARLDRICAKLELAPGEHLLEIGTGWGGLAIHAARTRGCRVTTATISRAQYEYATESVASEGLAHLVEVRLVDYRDLAGHYDKLVSIEMVEAVGERWLDTYFERCNALLAPHGQMLLQAITIRDQYYEQALRSVDFIQRHVFPGSFIPSISALTERVATRTDCTVAHLEDIGPHYARTLREWRTRFLARREEVRALGYDEEFLRLWEYYLAYCEGGFEERALGDVQLLLTKPLCRRAPFTG